MGYIYRGMSNKLNELEAEVVVDQAAGELTTEHADAMQLAEHEHVELERE
ncbi:MULTISPECIES: hypothetical protein [unclassified Pseudomonas]|nr:MULTISPECIES: hypothetical protein [unclassified Pseudomonas]MBC3423894.1 hypothetical protein [Pseudomonas sp. RW3S2]MBC3465979.1 hypothetical protein [Pseudomonas sp. RW10S2]QXI45045.1 hypothetical protein HU734_009865 [Pseudomonas wayambapalatensis]